jgi:GT2 family glycosyltransferase
MSVPGLTPKEMTLALARVGLRSFLDSGCTLDFRLGGPPRVSILILVCNRAELTLRCLQTLALRLSQTPAEVVVVDNGSTDETGPLLRRCHGLKILRNAENAGYPRAVNQAARVARGDYLLLLNNDAEVLGKSIDAAAGFLEANPDVGAVGAKVVLLDGTLQEAGVTVWQTGWTHQQGRGAAADDPGFGFCRPVDYCSGAFLMTRRGLYGQFGGLDEAYSPGYFEDVDYCARVWQAGFRVFYLPDAVVLHFENATSGALGHLNEWVGRNHRLFCEKQARWLETRCPWTPHPVAARAAGNGSLNVLLVAEDFVHDEGPERAAARLAEFLARIEALDGFVTLCLTGAALGLRPHLSRIPRTVEVFCLDLQDGVRQLLASRPMFYDLVLARDPSLVESVPFPPLARPAQAVFAGGRFRPLAPEGSRKAA